MSLRKLTVELTLPTSATGRAAKDEHARALEAVVHLLRSEAWGAFSIQLYTATGEHIGQAMLSGMSVPHIKEEPGIGYRQQARA